MREVLLDIIKQTNGLVKIIKITGTPTETRIQAVDDNKVLFIEATLNDPIPEFVGEFGLGSLNMLKGLLEFANYRTDEATFTVKRRDWKETGTVEHFEFRDRKGAGLSVFRCMSPERVPDQAEIRNIPFDVDFTPNRSKLSEFAQLAALYAEVDKDKLFAVKTEGGNLLFCFGDDNASTHHGSMVFEEGVTGLINGKPLWQSDSFLKIMKLTGERDGVLRISSRGVLNIETQTEFGKYQYYMRAGSRSS